MKHTHAQASIIRDNEMLKEITADNVSCKRNTSNNNPDVIEYILEGPYDFDYGRLFIGRIFKEKKNGKDVFAVFGEARGNVRQCAQHHVGDFSKRKAAIVALAAYANDFHRPASIEQEFENMTEGGMPVVFIRRVNSGIIACVGSSRMSWSHDGVVDMFSGEPEKQRLYNLVKKPDFKPRHL